MSNQPKSKASQLPIKMYCTVPNCPFKLVKHDHKKYNPTYWPNSGKDPGNA